MSNTVLFKKSMSLDSDGNAVLPSADDMSYGEIAINYAAGAECISTKNSENNIVTLYFSDSDNSSEHVSDTDNPHEVTAEDIGLENVSNTADADFGINDTLQAKLDEKLDIAKIWAYTALTDGTNTYTEEELSEWACAASVGNILNTTLYAFVNNDTSDLESRIEALEDVLTAD